MSKIYFVSDTHFGSQRTLELSKRPFKSVEEMDSVIIKNWNETVGEDDVVYHLGDFGNYEIAKQLNGKIRLLKGNYERQDVNLEKYEDYFYDVILGETFSGYTTYEKNDLTHTLFINIAHEPSLVKDKKISSSSINLFGHIHKLCMIKSYGLNVGVDCHNFKPIDIETVLFYHNAILNHYDEEVFN